MSQEAIDKLDRVVSLMARAKTLLESMNKKGIEEGDAGSERDLTFSCIEAGTTEIKEVIADAPEDIMSQQARNELHSVLSMMAQLKDFLDKAEKKGAEIGLIEGERDAVISCLHAWILGTQAVIDDIKGKGVNSPE